MTKLATDIRTWPRSLVGSNLVWCTGYCDWRFFSFNLFSWHRSRGNISIGSLHHPFMLLPFTHLTTWLLYSMRKRLIYHKIEDKEIWVAHKGFAEDQSSGMLLLRRYCAEVSKVLVPSSTGSANPRRYAWPFSLTELNFCSSLSDTYYLLWLWWLFSTTLENFFVCPLAFWRRNYFFFILAHPVYKMWIIQEPNTLELWNKLHFEEEKTESIYRV